MVALAGGLESDFHIAFRSKSVGCLAGWLLGWLAGGVLSCVCMVNHFERVFTWLSDANLCFSFALARRRRSSAMCLYGYSILNVFSHGFPTQIGVVPMRFI